MSHPKPTTAHINSWDRAAIVALGGAGCALSYDALQQMATAIHIRGFLTFVFPLVIDGFIAYGVRALLVLRTAPSLPAAMSGCSSPQRLPPASGPTHCTQYASTNNNPSTLASASATSPSECCPPWPHSPWPEPSTCTSSSPAELPKQQ